jgi:diguanylate cyclase (GGDEF)-like protein
MTHGISMFDKDEKLIICNEPYAKLYGLPKEFTKAGTYFWDILEYGSTTGMSATKSPEQRKILLQKIIKDAIPIKKAYDMINGKTIFIQHQPMPDGGWLTTHEDITEQRKKEEIIKHRSDELLQQNIRFDAAVNNMMHGISMYDKNNNLIICNEPYAKLYNLPKELTKPGTSFWDILDNDALSGMVSIADKNERIKILGEVIKTKEPLTGPINMINGQIIFINHQPLDDGGWLTTHEDITEQHKSEELIRYLAKHDSLTGLANRGNFYETMDNNKANDLKIITAIMCIDLDRFKPINDNFGHGAGDEVIKTIAKRIKTHAGSKAIVSRLGGDEFAILLSPVSSQKEIETIAKNITNAISKPIKWEEIELNITASIGIALSPENGTSTQELMHNSDLALYYAKKQLGGSYCFFKEEMNEKRKKRQTIETGLRQALEKNELQLHYQPLISLKDNKISCCEALMRWQGEETSFSPFEFIPVAEETGLIRDLGNWALQTACAAAAKWPNGERVAVNVSPVQFKNNNLVAQVADALIVSGLDADRLELEITEGVFLSDSKQNMKILHDLKSLGVRIALDDFGTGYSSLSYLCSFPFDKIKIDRSFISSLDERKENIAIIKAVVDIGQSMGMATVAEGIETQEQLEAVREQGCSEVQGYLFSMPLPNEAINKMLNVPTKITKKLCA